MVEEFKLEELLDKISKLPENQRAIVSRDSGNVYNFSIINSGGNFPYVELIIAPEDRQYGIIHVRKEVKGFFPGYRRQFILETDVKPFVMHLTGAPNGTAIGSEEGGYLCHPMTNDVDTHLLQYAPDANDSRESSFKRWYEAHPLPEAAPNSSVRVYRIHNQLFRLRI